MKQVYMGWKFTRENGSQCPSIKYHVAICKFHGITKHDARYPDNKGVFICDHCSGNNMSLEFISDVFRERAKRGI